MNQKITIIGGGNLGQSIIYGLLNQGYSPSNLTITRQRVELLSELSNHNVTITSDNIKAVTNANIVIIAVKPHTIKSILNQIGSKLNPNTIVISVVSDYSLKDIQSNLPNNITTIFRAMPNTATEVLESITCIAHSETAKNEQVKIVESLFNYLGKTVIINESLMNAATVLGACGIAYALRFIRAMMQGGIEIGFDAETANLIATQTVKGASELLLKNKRHPESEIDKVTTPKGCTISGLNEMEHNGFSAALIKGLKTSFNKLD